MFTIMADLRCFVALMLCLFLSFNVASGYNCPGDYDFPSCPREGESEELNTCCTVDGLQQCCTGSEALESWAIWLISLACIGVVCGLGICLCCLCGWCACIFKTCQCCCNCLCCCCGGDDDEKTSLTA